MANKIEIAYKNVKPSDALIKSTLEKIKKRRLRQNVTLLIVQYGISAALSTALAFALGNITQGMIVFVILNLVFTAIFVKKNSTYLEERFVSDNKAKLNDNRLDFVLGGSGTDVARKEPAINCSQCGADITYTGVASPCPICGHIEEPQQ